MSKRGFNLAEVVVAVTVLGLVLILLMGLMLTAASGASSTLESAQATTIAENELDHWRRKEFGALVAAMGNNVGSVVADGREYDLNTVIERLDSTAASDDYDVLKLVCTVSWETRTVDPASRHRFDLGPPLGSGGGVISTAPSIDTRPH